MWGSGLEDSEVTSAGLPGGYISLPGRLRGEVFGGFGHCTALEDSGIARVSEDLIHNDRGFHVLEDSLCACEAGELDTMAWRI